MNYVQELLPLVEALKAAGYTEDGDRERYRLRMKKPIGDRAIVVVVCDDSSRDVGPHAMPMKLHASFKEKSFDRNFEVSGFGDGEGSARLVAELEAHLLASD